jgi:lipopolysaccharide transport system permease protein
MLESMVRHRQLIFEMIKRDVIGRYRGSVGGLVWSFINPLLMLGVYTFVFAVVFKARWGTGEGTANPQFAIILFVGMIVHALFAEAVNKAPGLILSNVNYVKKVIFPLEILPVVAVGSAVFHMLISIIILLLFHWILAGHVAATVLWLPVVILPFILITLGLAWFLAATGVYVRDISQTTGILTTVLLFLSPVFYPASSLPEAYRPYLNLNPLTFIIEQARAVTLWGTRPDFAGLAFYTVIALVFAAIGFWWFQRTRSGFADVL